MSEEEEEEEEERKSPSLPYARTHARGREGETEERLGERRRGRNGIWRERGERERKEKERVRRERGEEFPPASPRDGISVASERARG